ncbi:MAG TPA: lipopolysaccharide heptosyltransferase II [Gemmatimonadales bacterium]|nr:lipopolysaccharide heptosyltransferase II [Gemmatimonadales bacterium]
MPAPRILLVRFSSLGDVLLTTPLIRVLRAQHPAATLSAVTKQMWAPLLSANPHLDEVVSVAPGQSLVPLARALRSARFTHLLDLHGNVRTRVLRLLVPGPWTGFDARRRARQRLIREHVDTYRDHVPVAERYFEAARGLEVRPDGRAAELFTSPAAEARAHAWLARVGFEGDSPLIALAPGSAHATKRWPIRHWRRLASDLVRRGVNVALIGGPADRVVAAEIATSSGRRAASAAGELDLQASGALLRHARAAVTGDTGPMHLATAVDAPVVALFGPTVEQFGFFPYHARATVLERDLPCRPCSSKGGPRCPLGHHRCLEDIAPAEVLAKVTGYCS